MVSAAMPSYHVNPTFIVTQNGDSAGSPELRVHIGRYPHVLGGDLPPRLVGSIAQSDDRKRVSWRRTLRARRYVHLKLTCHL